MPRRCSALYATLLSGCSQSTHGWYARTPSGSPHMPQKRCTAAGLNEHVQTIFERYLNGEHGVQECHFLPNAAYVFDRDGRQACHVILNHSNLDVGLDRYLATHDLPPISAQIPHARERGHRFRSPCDKLTADDLDARSRALLVRAHRVDFERLGFAIPNRRSGPPLK